MTIAKEKKKFMKIIVSEFLKFNMIQYANFN